MKLHDEVKYVLWPWGWMQRVGTGVILGCTQCGKARVERKDGRVFVVNSYKVATAGPSVAKENGPVRPKGHDADMAWDR
jgi:hypothetical protein